MDTGFIPVTLELKAQYDALWKFTPVKSLDYTLTNLWGWQEYYGLEWRFERNLCWIRQTVPQVIHWAPLGDWAAIDWRDELIQLVNRTERHFHRVPQQLVQIWRDALQDRIEAIDERGQWEYLYRQEELAELPGNRFHKKRNHFNAYVKSYGEPDYRSIDEAMIREVLSVQEDWCQTHECEDSPSLVAENSAIWRVLNHWENFGDLLGGSLYVDGRMIAFSIGEPLDGQNLGVHFEKGLNGYKGVYQAMNCEFARRAGAGFTWINRAQDLDEEGLRQAKMTYLPADYLRKYDVVIKR